MCVSRTFQGRFKEDLRVFQGGFEVSQRSSKGVSRKFKVFQGSFMGCFKNTIRISQ